ncbi:MAG: dihydroorotate dehydrogenase electron transfer subunit [Nitrososphaeraceae archaeon]
MADHTDTDILRLVRIRKAIEETATTRTIVFDDEYSVASMPGQFLMVWIPQIEELPMSIGIESFENLKCAAVTVRKYGLGSTALYHKQVGEHIGIRGPYGNHFSIPENLRNVLLIGGGTGLVPLVRLFSDLVHDRIQTSLIMGARTKEEVIFQHKVQNLLADNKLNNCVAFSTDDGTYGFKGSTVDLAESILASKKFDMMYTCGPELMMKGVQKLGERFSIPVEASLERYMKCAIGICGSCCINDKLVCQDGTIFDSNSLRQLTEFGVSYRDKSGRSSYFISQK